MNTADATKLTLGALLRWSDGSTPRGTVLSQSSDGRLLRSLGQTSPG